MSFVYFSLAFHFIFINAFLSEEYYLLVYNAMQSVESQPTFRRNMIPSSGSKNKPSEKPASKQVATSAYFSTPKMEAICSSETSVDFQRTTRRYIPEDSSLHNHRCEYLKSYAFLSIFSS
jgi:hypothetical protein